MCGSIPCVLKLVDEPVFRESTRTVQPDMTGTKKEMGMSENGEVTGKESDSGARDGGGESGMGGGVLGN